MTSYRAAVVSGHGSVIGIVGDSIVVIPDMSPTRVGEVINARGVVSEVGGALAHLAIVCREQGKTMMVMPDACSVLTAGMRVTLNPACCEIRIES